MNQFLAGCVVVVFGRELTAVGVFVVEPGIDSGKDGSLAVFRRGHENVSVIAKLLSGRDVTEMVQISFM